MRNASTKSKKAIVYWAAGIGLAAGLVACSGGPGPSGEYYNDEGRLVVHSDSVAFYPFGCSDSTRGVAVIATDPSAEGQISGDGSHVLWNSDDEHLGSDRISGATSIDISKSGDALKLGDYDFAAMDADEALTVYKGMC